MTTAERELIDGAEAIARGALDAGCDFFAGYPITPASGILTHMLRELPKVGGVGIQGEDEIASIGFCIGAALAGARPMTASSGPGLALYAENIGVAIMVEVPLVIAVVQRLGPATGAATAGAQGDVQFIRWGTSGGYPIIALAPTNVAECYHLTRRAFALARRFRAPVFLATDKEVVTTTESVAVGDLASPPAGWPPVPEAPAVPPLAPFGVRPPLSPGPVPASALRPLSHEGSGPPCPPSPLCHEGRSGEGDAGGDGGPADDDGLRRYNASSHDERGYITKDPTTLERLSRRLTAKIEDRLAELELVEADLAEGARTLVLSYGVTARSVAEAVQRARSEGRPVSALTVYGLWPVPEAAIRAAAAGMGRVVVAELNRGQYRREIERVLGGAVEVVGVNRTDGQLITPEEILAEVVR